MIRALRLLALALPLAPLPACALQTFLASSYNLTSASETELTDLDSSVTVVSTGQGFFILATLTVQNTGQAANVHVRIHETTTAISDTSATILVPHGNWTIQVPRSTDGAALGLGAHEFEVHVEKDGSGTFTFTDDSYLGLFSNTTPGGGVVSLNALTAAVQVFATPTKNCQEPTWSSSSSTHTLCIPMDGSAFDSICVGEGCVASGLQCTCIGEDCSCDAGNAIGVGDASNPGANSACIGLGCTSTLAQFSFGALTQEYTEICFGQGCSVANALSNQTATSGFTTIHNTDEASATNVSGTHLRLRGGKGRGTGNGGSVVLQHCETAGSGSTANSCSDDWKLSTVGDFVPVNNLTVNLGGASARPATGYFGTLDVSVDAVPDSNGGADLGRTGLRWANAYIQTLTLTNPLGVAYGGLGRSYAGESGFMTVAAGVAQAAAFPRQSVPFTPGQLAVDGTQCTAAADVVIRSTGPRAKAINCADNAASEITGSVLLPDRFSGTALIVEIYSVNKNATPSGAIGWDFYCACAVSGAAIPNWGSAAANLDATFATQYLQQNATSGSLTTTSVCAGTASCVAGSTLYYRFLMDASTTTTQVADTYFLGGAIEESTTATGD